MLATVNHGRTVTGAAQGELTSSGRGVDRRGLGVGGSVARPRQGAALAVPAGIGLARRRRTRAAIKAGPSGLRLGLVKARALRAASLAVIHCVGDSRRERFVRGSVDMPRSLEKNVRGSASCAMILGADGARSYKEVQPVTRSRSWELSATAWNSKSRNRQGCHCGNLAYTVRLVRAFYTVVL
jgi:hypothetical protein